MADAHNDPTSGSSAAPAPEHLSAGALGDVDAVIAAAVNASKQHAEQERLQEEQQRQAQEQSEGAATAMDVDTNANAEASTSAQPQAQSDIDPSAAVADVARSTAQSNDPDASMTS